MAAVVAGLITGHGAARRLPARHRLSDAQNWHTVELVLEGAIFLTPLLVALRNKARRGVKGKPRLAAMEEWLESPSPRVDRNGKKRVVPPPARRRERVASYAHRALFDIDYFLAAPL